MGGIFSFTEDAETSTAQVIDDGGDDVNKANNGVKKAQNRFDKIDNWFKKITNM